MIKSLYQIILSSYTISEQIMKRTCFSLAFLLVTITVGYSQPLKKSKTTDPVEFFHRGVNLTNWFQTSDVHDIAFNKFTKQDFMHIKSLGCDVIRLPINLHAMTSGAPDYTIDPLFYSYLDQAVSWAEELQLRLIIDNHTFDPSVSTSTDIGSILEKVWKQMANHYKNRSHYIYYEILNEPHGISNKLWGKIQGHIIDTIRTVDPTHTIVVGGADWNSYNDLQGLPHYADDNLIYTFHFYDPMVFTHQGASWTDPSMVLLSGVPFPYNASRVPVTPTKLKGTWVESSLDNYKNLGTVAHLKKLLDIAAKFKKQRGVPVFCGEFGVYRKNSPNSDRVHWYEQVQKYLEKNGIPWTIWDYEGGFGVFKKNTQDRFGKDLNIPMLQALGFKTPGEN